MESWEKRLYITWGIIFFHYASIGMLVPFLPLYIKELGVIDPQAQSVWSGIIYGSTFIFSALLSPLWGTLSDKYGRKPLILRTTFGISVLTILMSFVTNVYQLLALRILQGVCSGIFPALVALVSLDLPRDKTGQGLGTMQTAIVAGSIIGPFIGGILADWMGYRNVLLVISTLAFIASVATLLFIHEPKRDLTQARATVLNNIKLVISSQSLRMVIVTMFTIQVSLFIVEPILPLFIVVLHGTSNSATMVGLIFSMTGFAAILFAPYRGRVGDKKGHMNVLTQSLLFTGIAFFPQALVTSAYQLLPLRAIIGFFIAGIMPSTQSMVVNNTTDSQRGGVLGITHSVNMAGQAAGPLVGGLLGAAFGYRVPFVLTSILLISISYFFGTFIKDTASSQRRTNALL